MGTRSISTKELRAESQVLERAVLSARLSTKEALAPHRPGGAENPGKDARGWFSYYRHLVRVHARADRSSPSATVDREAADRNVLNALRAEPVRVNLVPRLDGAEPVLYVYAKSLDALLHITALDRQLAWFTRQHALLVAMGTPDAIALLPRATAEISYTYGLLSWIVTTPGPGLPYLIDAERPELPAHIVALEPWDIVRIVEAHHKHLLRVHAVSQLIDERSQNEEGGSRPSWSMFAANAAEMFGADPVVITRDRPLAALLAATWLNSAAKAPRELPERETATRRRAGRETLGVG
jgi:hypothetical protein